MAPSRSSDEDQIMSPDQRSAAELQILDIISRNPFACKTEACPMVTVARDAESGEVVVTSSSQTYAGQLNRLLSQRRDLQGVSVHSFDANIRTDGAKEKTGRSMTLPRKSQRTDGSYLRWPA